MKLSLFIVLCVLCVASAGFVGGCSSEPPEKPGPALGSTTPGGGVISSEGRAAKGKMPHMQHP